MNGFPRVMNQASVLLSVPVSAGVQETAPHARPVGPAVGGPRYLDFIQLVLLPLFLSISMIVVARRRLKF